MIKTTVMGYGEPTQRLLETYVYRLDNYLPTYYPSISWHVYNSTVKGATTAHLIKELEQKVFDYRPNVVFINLTSNDICTMEKSSISLNQFKQNLITLAQTIRLHKNRTGLNGCIPIPVFITPPPVNEEITKTFRTNNRLKQYVYVVKQVAKKYNVPLINLFEVLSQKEDYKDYLSKEGFLLNQEGHDLLYDLVFIELIKLINYQGVLKDRDVIED